MPNAEEPYSEADRRSFPADAISGGPRKYGMSGPDPA